MAQEEGPKPSPGPPTSCTDLSVLVNCLGSNIIVGKYLKW